MLELPRKLKGTDFGITPNSVARSDQVGDRFTTLKFPIVEFKEKNTIDSARVKLRSNPICAHSYHYMFQPSKQFPGFAIGSKHKRRSVIITTNGRKFIDSHHQLWRVPVICSDKDGQCQVQSGSFKKF